MKFRSAFSFVGFVMVPMFMDEMFFFFFVGGGLESL